MSAIGPPARNRRLRVLSSFGSLWTKPSASVERALQNGQRFVGASEADRFFFSQDPPLADQREHEVHGRGKRELSGGWILQANRFVRRRERSIEIAAIA